MSKNIREDISTIIYRVLWILTALQMGMGVLWIFFNFSFVPGFSGTAEMLEISETLVTDEYVGILYPLLVKAAQLLDSFLPIPYQCFLYGLQLGIGYFALRTVFGELHCKYGALICLWVLTIPTVLQLFLAVLPQALAVSILILCIYSCCKEKWIDSGIYWLVSGLLIPEYFVFGGIAYVLAWGNQAVRGRLGKQRMAQQRHEQQKSLVKGLICFLAVCVLTVSVGSLVQEPYSRGRMERTPLSVALQRVVWPHYYTNSYFWVLGVHETFDSDDLWNLSQNPERPMYDFGPVLEQNYDSEYVDYIYRQMIGVTFEVNTKDVVFDMANDLIEYAIPPVALLCNLEGIGVSYSGWNYMWMKSQAPILTRYYVQYSCILFGIFLIAAAGCRIGRGREKKQSAGNRMFPFLMLTVAAAQILWYTMSASGMQDYCNVPFVSMAYGIFIMSVFFREKEK